MLCSNYEFDGRMTRRWGRAERARQLDAVVEHSCRVDDRAQLSCVVREVTSQLDRSFQMLLEG